MIICLSAAIFTAAIGVRILVRVNIVQSAFNILLQEGDYFKRKRIKKKEASRIISRQVTVVYWLAATAIYILYMELFVKQLGINMDYMGCSRGALSGSDFQ